MLKTITIGNHFSVQGLLVRTLEDGRMVVRVDNKMYEGQAVVAPVSSHTI